MGRVKGTELAGMLFVCLIAIRNEDTDACSVRFVHSLRCPLRGFPEQTAQLEAEISETVAEEQVLRSYCFLGSRAQVKAAMDAVTARLRELFKRCAAEEDFDLEWTVRRGIRRADLAGDFAETAAWVIAEHMMCRGNVYMPQRFELTPAEGELVIGGLGLGLEYEDQRLEWMAGAASIWAERELPWISGKQVMIRSFLLSDLAGRRIVGVLPETDGDGFFLLVEGGRTVRLANDMSAYVGDQLGYMDIGRFSINDVNTILQNPGDEFGKNFQPYQQFEDWQRVFLYALAVLPVEWSAGALRPVYRSFLEFMEREICNVEPGRAALPEEQFFACLLKKLDMLRQYLCCEEEVVLSKDWLRVVKSRHIYLNLLYRLLGEMYPAEAARLTATPPFAREEFFESLLRAEQWDAHGKGRAWEDVAGYMMERIPGLVVTGRRIRISRQEIDLSCANVSLDERLWELGALILVECKNWEKRVGVPVIRNMSQIMRVKGNITSILFCRNGVTRAVLEEIRQEALMGEYILCITREDLCTVCGAEDFYEILMEKWTELQRVIEDDIALLG